MSTNLSARELTTRPVDEQGGKGLKTGALGMVSSLVIGVASTAPAYSLAASLGFVTLAVGRFAPSVMLLAFIPMLFIAAGYYYLNRADADCGTTFIWVTRALGPKTGWMSGWGMLMTDLVVMPNLAQIAGQYSFTLFGAYGLAASTVWTTIVGVIWIIVMTLICYIGIELSARTQVLLLGSEIVVLAVFAVVALVKVAGGKVAHSLTPSFGWLDPFKISSGGALASGILTAVFIYWGWDTAVSVNEESKDANRTPGVAAILSTLVLLGIYVVVSIAAQAFHGPGFLTDHYTDVLSALGKAVLGSPWNKVLIIAVLTSASASTQTTILPAARSTLSMAVHKAAPQRFGTINHRFLSPGFSTLFFGGVSVIWYVCLTLLSNQVLQDSILALGFGIAFYYGMTGFACVVYYRRHIFTSFKNFVFIGLAPLLGGLMLTWAFVYSIFVYSNPSNSTDDTTWFSFVKFNVHFLGIHLYAHGLGPPLVLGVGLLLLGVPLMIIWMIGHPEFFRHDRQTSVGVGEPAPPLTAGVTPVLD